ncbi:MAG: flavin reductase family protein [Dehalococcoidia bacterium]
MGAEEASDALKLVSYGLYVVGAKSGDEVNGMTANWLTQVSFDPRLVAVAVENDAHTHQMITDGKVFSVNLLESGQMELMEKFTQPQAHAGSKLGEEDYITAVTGAPVLRAALAWFDCELTDTVVTGDHTVFIGRVVDGGVQRGGVPLTLRETGWDYGG